MATANRVSVATHVVLLAVSIPAAAVLAMFGTERDHLSQMLAPFALVPLLVAWLVWLTLIYKMWDALRGEKTIGPWLAVLLAVVPGISAFGVAFSLLRYPGAFNEAMQRRSVAEPRLGLGAPLALVVLAVVLPLLAALGASMNVSHDTQAIRGVLVITLLAGALAFYVVQLRHVAKLCHAINAARQTGP